MPPPPHESTDTRLLHLARAAAVAHMGRYHVPGLSVAVTDRERLLYAEGFGHADLAGRRRASAASAQAMRTTRTPGRPFDLGLGWFRRPADRNARPGFVEHWGTGAGFWNALRL